MLPLPAAFGADGQPPNDGQPTPALPPLQVSGLVVSKAALLAALRLWMPALRDLTPLDDGQFLLRVHAEPAEGSPR